MTVARLALALAMVLLVGVPIALAPRDTQPASGARSLVIFTPHNEAIREEFKQAFEAWHARTYGEAVEVVWSAPGGTSDIRKMLEAACIAALRRGLEPGGQGDLLFGGGSYEFRQLAKELSAGPTGNATADGSAPRSASVLAPVALDPALIADIYGGRTHVGDNPLYDPKGMWFGAALSGFGIVFNRDLLSDLGMRDADGNLIEPKHWADLCDPRFEGWIALVNPAQSGSVTTAYEAILQRRGWIDGWRILHRLAGNARTFSASSPRAPTDVSIGDAAAGVCIDFYGRFQSQAIDDASAARPSDRPSRVGYVDPAGETVIDPDPVAMLRGAPHPELAKRFIEFTLSAEGQSLWNFRARSRLAAAGTPAKDGLGPERHELRRMPVRASLYRDSFERLIDRVDPFTIATAVENPNPDYRSLLPALFVAMAIENRALLGEAWRAIISHPGYPRPKGPLDGRVIAEEDVTDPVLREMIRRFDSFPMVPGPGGGMLSLGDASRLKEIRTGWLSGGWSKEGLWPSDASPSEVLRGIMTAHYRSEYEAIIRLAQGGGGER
jgi:iron(III) transport system substrate-binding protein